LNERSAIYGGEFLVGHWNGAGQAHMRLIFRQNLRRDGAQRLRRSLAGLDIVVVQHRAHFQKPTQFEGLRRAA
jgi:hypothetical protein